MYNYAKINSVIKATDNMIFSACVPTCSAGVGRTGTFIALDICLKQVKSNFVVEVPTTVNRMRCQRMNLVLTLVSVNIPVYWGNPYCIKCVLHALYM